MTEMFRLIVGDHSNVNGSKRLQVALEALCSGCVFILLSNEDYSFSKTDVSSTILFTFP